MAQRSSRSKKKRTRYTPPREGEKRTGTSRAERAKRSEERRAAATTASVGGTRVRVRPAGAVGALVQFGIAWLGVAAVAGLGLYLHRWNALSYPDSLWLYVSFGTVAVAWALGTVARSRSDADSWGAQALLVPLGMLVAEVVIGPGCPDGGNCAAIGARGWLTLPGSILLVVLLAIVSWQLAGMSYRRAVRRRPGSGRVSALIAAVGMIVPLLLAGVPIALALVSSDVFLRDTPQLVDRAKSRVLELCFPVTPNDPELVVRPNPDGLYPTWTSLLVRNANETRRGVSGKRLGGDWNAFDTAHPYEASIVFDGNGDPATSIRCRMVDPATGMAKADDLKQDPVPTTEKQAIDPLTGGEGAQVFPQFYAQPIDQLETARKAAEKAAADAKAAEKPKDQPATTKPAAG